MAESWYARHVLPRLMDLGCGAASVTALRRALLPEASGRVIEIGLGTGRNLPFYDPAKVARVIGVDPAGAMLLRARTRAEAQAFPVELRALSGEALPFETGEADSLVCTFSLCSIADPDAALAEMRRVLKPDGLLFFAEHGASPEPGVRRWQDRVNAPWGRIAGGCNINRPMVELIEAGGFALRRTQSAYLKGSPKILSYCTSGVAAPR
ncbi:MAG: class I SAM-dependent methyltransferase [Rhodospirillales bacterium]